MRAALAVWNNRIAPVFDVAANVLLVDFDDPEFGSPRLQAFRPSRSVSKVEQLREMGVDLLVCGAISRPVESLAAASGIDVVGFVAGPQDEVLNALQTGRLDSRAFAMPGCGRRRRRGAGRCGEHRRRHRSFDTKGESSCLQEIEPDPKVRDR